MNIVGDRVFNETEINEFPLLHHWSHGFVYAFSMNGATKIGCTYQPERRFKALIKEVGPCNALIYFSKDSRNYYRLEHSLHEIFKKKGRWITGEWFQISIEEAIAEIKKCNFRHYDDYQSQLLGRKFLTG